MDVHNARGYPYWRRTGVHPRTPESKAAQEVASRFQQFLGAQNDPAMFTKLGTALVKDAKNAEDLSIPYAVITNATSALETGLGGQKEETKQFINHLGKQATVTIGDEVIKNLPKDQHAEISEAIQTFANKSRL